MKFIILSLVVGFYSQQLIARSLTIGVYAYNPQVLFVKGSEGEVKAQGQAISLLRKVIQESGYQVSFIKLPLKRALKELKSNNVDMLFPIIDPPASVKVISTPVVKSVPGLCFKPKNFVAILSAEQQLKGMTIAYEAGTSIVPLKGAPIRLQEVHGGEVRKRIFSMLEKGRVNAFYHSNPRIIYQENQPEYRKVACSSYYGHTSNIYLGASDKFFEQSSDLFYRIEQQLEYEIQKRKQAKQS